MVAQLFYTALAVSVVEKAVEMVFHPGVPEPPPPVELARLRYEHTLRALNRHTVVLSELRSRASIVLSATGLIASFVASQALQHPHPTGLVVVALVSAAAALVCCIAVIWPVHDKGKLDPEIKRPLLRRGRRRTWKVTLGRKEMERLPWDVGEAAVLEAMVAALDPARRVNYRTLEVRSRAFTWACVLLPMQILFWVLVILF